MKTLKILLSVDKGGPAGFRYQAGDIVDVDDETAYHLILRGAAEEYVPPTPVIEIADLPFDPHKLSVAEIEKMVRSVYNCDLLLALKQRESTHPRHGPAGRQGIKAAIERRLADLTPTETTDDEI